MASDVFNPRAAADDRPLVCIEDPRQVEADDPDNPSRCVDSVHYRPPLPDATDNECWPRCAWHDYLARSAGSSDDGGDGGR